MSTEVVDPVSVVPLECRKALKRLRYHDVARHDQQAWLEEHFFQAADVPGTGGMAGVESVRRVRQVCWGAINSKPTIWRVRDHALQLVVHEPDSELPPHWRWPLALCAMEGEWFPGEALWCLTRTSVLPPMLSRLCGLSLLSLAASTVAADLGDFPRRAEEVFRTTTAVSEYQAELVGQLEQTIQVVPVALTELILAARALFEVDSVASLRHTMGLSASACQAGVYDIVTLQRQMLSALKCQIAFGDPTKPK